MMEDAKAAAGEHTKVVAVTVLTSLDDDDMSAIGYANRASDQALRLAELAHSAGSTASCVRAMKWAISAAVEGRLFRRPRPAPRRWRSGRSKARRDAARRARCRGQRAGHRPPDHAGRRSAGRRPRHRSDCDPMTDIRVAIGADLPALKALVERAYRGDSARGGWTHEADLLDDNRTSVAELERVLADPSNRVLVAQRGDAGRHRLDHSAQ
jgi:hypothetical protein